MRAESLDQAKKLVQEIKIGWWHARCCCQDAYKIESEVELEELKNELLEEREDYEWVMCPNFYPTKEMARNELCGCKTDEDFSYCNLKDV